MSDPPELDEELLDELELELDEDELELLELDDELDELEVDEFELLEEDELLEELLDEELEEPVPPDDEPVPPQAASTKVSALAPISFARRCWFVVFRSKVIIFPVIVRLFMTICGRRLYHGLFRPVTAKTEK